jgi:hypothetical protein
MRYIAATIISLFISNFTFSQNADSSLIDLHSNGFLVDLMSQNFTNNTNNTSSYNPGKHTAIDLILNSTIWKFTPKYNLAAVIEMGGTYQYSNHLDLGYNKTRRFNARAFGDADYYFMKNYYVTSSGSFEYNNGTFENVSNSNSEHYHKSAYNYANSYFWIGLGYGRIVNTASITKEVNFEKILKEQKIILSVLPVSVKRELDALIEKRNNKDFISKYHDNSDAEFFAEVENILRKNGVINNSLDAETTIKLYDALNNERYLYYPNYAGFQLQTEAQYEINYTEFNNFVTFGGIYGLPLSTRSNLLFSGFFSLPLNNHADAIGLFYNGYKTPFNNYLPVLVQKYKLDNTDFIRSREYITHSNENMRYFTGAKAILFQKFNEFAGVRGYVSSVVSSSDTLSTSNASAIGAILDYNIFSHLTLNFQAEYEMTSRAKPFFYYNLGFLWNIF